MPATEIFKHCLDRACRRSTLHRLVPGISKPLYRCTTTGCSAAAREVTKGTERVAVLDPELFGAGAKMVSLKKVTP